MLLKTLVLSIGWLSASLASADCFDQIRLKSEKIFQTQKEEYLRFDPKNGQVIESNSPVLIKGTNNKAVLVQHGFMASPFEVKIIGDTLAAAGYTVYMPLIAGFGSSSKVANYYKAENWKNYFNENVEALELCYSDITLVGFSTGGTLVFDYISSHLNDKKIKAAVMLSPFFKMHLNFTTLLSNISRGLESFPIKLIPRTLSPDLQAVRMHPAQYNSTVPLVAATEVTKLGGEVLAKTVGVRIKIPTMVVFSEADQTINQAAVIQVIGNNLEKFEVVSIPKSLNIPHQIAVPSVSSEANSIAQKVLNFVERAASQQLPVVQ